MIVNGQYFVRPQRSSATFKELFARLAAEGVGRPVDQDGLPDGPWTPEKLADAISSIDANRDGIELRAVQVWFQDNDNGISNDNIRWLAKIFGCNDPEATSQWQAELAAAKERLARKRREKRKHDGNGTEIQTHTSTIDQQVQNAGISGISEKFFSDGGPFNIIVVLWACTTILLYVAYLFGVHDVSYRPADGINKQVGLFWSPNWYLDKLILLPLLVIYVSNTLSMWRRQWRASLVVGQSEQGILIGWAHKSSSYSLSFWIIFFVSVFITFLLQWYGSYLIPLMQNDIDQRVVDWLLVATERPEVMSASMAIFVSMVANIMSGIGYWYCFAGLMWLYVITSDFKDLCSSSTHRFDAVKRREAIDIGGHILHNIYRCTILALLASTTIKTVAVYLMTDAENILAWLISDTLTFFGLREEDWGWFDKSPAASITSFFVMFIPCFVFFFCLSQIYGTLRTLLITFTSQSCDSMSSDIARLSELRARWAMWAAIILLLVFNFWMIGNFSGFSILLFGSLALACYSILASPQNWVEESIA